MSAVYLPIRSFGDFIITASVIKEHAFEKIPVIIPQYLTDIFNCVGANQYFEIVKSISFTDQPAFFEMYKVKDLKNMLRLVNNMSAMFGVLKDDNTYLFDYRSRRLLYTGANLKWPVATQNIYQAKHQLFNRYFNLKPYQPEFNIPLINKENTSVLILPDSRIKTKEINPLLVNDIKNHFQGKIAINTAKFSREPLQNTITYSNFNELLKLIHAHHLIISAESLPYHLANYCNKPHFVIYNQSRHFKSTFMTPYMHNHGFYAFYEQNNIKSVLTKLEDILV